MPEITGMKNPNNNPPLDSPPVRVSDQLTDAQVTAAGFNLNLFRWFRDIWNVRGKFGW